MRKNPSRQDNDFLYSFSHVQPLLLWYCCVRGTIIPL